MFTRVAVDIPYSVRQQGAEPVWCRCQLGCTRSGARRHHLANMIEPSMCGIDVALCEITSNEHLI